MLREAAGTVKQMVRIVTQFEFSARPQRPPRLHGEQSAETIQRVGAEKVEDVQRKPN